MNYAAHNPHGSRAESPLSPLYQRDSVFTEFSTSPDLFGDLSPSPVEVKMPGVNLQNKSFLPNDIRENLIQAGLIKAAFILDALYWHGIQDNWITVADLCGIMPDTSETLIRQALNESTVMLCRPIKNGKRGRPTLQYQAKPIDQLTIWWAGARRKIGAPVPRIDDLPEAAFGSIRSYRLHLHAEYLQRNSQHGTVWHQASQVFMASRLGISPRTLRRYHEEIKPEVKETYEVSRIKPAQLPEAATDHRPMWLEIGSLSQIVNRQPTRRIPATRPAAEWALANGHQIHLVRRRSNRYRLGAIH